MKNGTTTEKITMFGRKLEIEFHKLRSKPFVKAGFPQEAGKNGSKFSQIRKQKKGETERGTKTVGYIATVQEFGSPEQKIPSRSFVRRTHDEQKEKWLKRTESYRKLIMAGKMTVEIALERLGLELSSDMKKTIKKGIPPPLALSTLQARLRKSKKGYAALDNPEGRSPIPLMDTGQTIQSLTYKSFVNGKGK